MTIDQIVLDQHRLRPGEFAVALAELAELVEIFAIPIEDLNAIVVAILADEDMPLRIERDVGRIDELPRPGPHLAQLPHALSHPAYRPSPDDNACPAPTHSHPARPSTPTGLPCCHSGICQSFEVIALVIQMLNAGDAIDDEEGVVGGLNRRSRADKRPGPGPVPVSHQIASGCAGFAASDERIAKPQDETQMNESDDETQMTKGVSISPHSDFVSSIIRCIHSSVSGLRILAGFTSRLLPSS